MVADNRVLIDTSIMVDMLRGAHGAMDYIDRLGPENRLLSFITVAELLAGCRNKYEQKKVERELQGYVVVYLDIESCKQGLEWYRKIHLSHGAGLLDCLIAATGHRQKVPIATLNDKHFRGIRSISVVRPY